MFSVLLVPVTEPRVKRVAFTAPPVKESVAIAPANRPMRMPVVPAVAVTVPPLTIMLPD